MFSPHTFGVSEGEYAAAADDSLLVIVQIESKSAVENVEEIAKVPGLDVLFIGRSRHDELANQKVPLILVNF